MNLHAGDLVDHYRIESRVARSGMASVFRATDTRNGQQVASEEVHVSGNGATVPQLN